MLDRISYHAVIRFLERAHGLPVAVWLNGTEHFNERTRAEHCCTHAGLTVADVRASILTPALTRIMEYATKGRVTLRMAGLVYVIDGGNLVTILTADMHRPRKQQPAKVLSRSEARRVIDNGYRRNKHKPAGCKG